MAIKIPRLVREFLRKLPIQWEVVIEPRKGDLMIIESELIDPEKKRGRHRIFAPTSCLANPEYYKVNWAHELCHAVLAEKLDLIFSSSPVVDEIEPKEKERRAEILFFARLHEDLLVNDAREELLGRQFTIEDVRSTHLNFLKIVKFAQTEFAQTPEVIKIFQDPLFLWMIAQNIAEDERYNCQVGAIEALNFLEPVLRQKVKAILAIYRCLPRLSWDPVTDLREFELSVQRIVTEIFQENWKAQIVSHSDFPGRKVWSVA